MAPKQRTAFITTRKGFCYLTVKRLGRNWHITRIRNYAIDAQEKRDLRRRHPDVAFDWKKIDRQLAEKRKACRRYRSRRRTSGTAGFRRHRGPLSGVFDPITRTVYADDVPSTAGGVAALLDAVLSLDRGLQADPSPSPAPLEPRRGAKPGLDLIAGGRPPATRKRPG
jgi:hypothetical protein